MHNSSSTKRTSSRRRGSPLDVALTKLENSDTNESASTDNANDDYRSNKSGNNLYELDFQSCTPWEYADRLEADFGDMEGLIESIRDEGQQQPALVRPIVNADSPFKYEIIFGVRRWKACQSLGLDLIAKIETLNDREAADRMISENLRRENLSEYSRCMSYKRLLDSGVYKDQKDLSHKVGLSPQAISDLFVFNRLPKHVVDEIKDFTKVSIGTALKLYKLRMEPEFQKNLPKVADDIRKGEINQSNLQRKLQDKPEVNNENTEKPLVVHGPNKARLLEVKRDTKGNVQVKIAKEYIGDRSIEGIFNSIKSFIQ